MQSYLHSMSFYFCTVGSVAVLLLLELSCSCYFSSFFILLYFASVFFASFFFHFPTLMCIQYHENIGVHSEYTQYIRRSELVYTKWMMCIHDIGYDVTSTAFLLHITWTYMIEKMKKAKKNKLKTKTNFKNVCVWSSL